MKVFIKAGGSSRPYEVDFTGQTFGELKKVAAAQGHTINWANTNTIVRTTQNILATDDSLVPQEENLVLLVVTKKSAAGLALGSYHDLGRNDLLRYTSGVVAEGGEAAKAHFGTFSSKKTDMIVELLDQYFATQETTSSVDVEEVLEWVQDAKDLLGSALDAVTKVGELLGSLRVAVSAPAEELFGGFTQSQLNEDHARITAVLS